MTAPEPLVPADCDCTNLDGFLLNVERLMASELVALSSHEVVAAALFLWCRAWKQRPAASLPDDQRVLAAYARLSLPRFLRVRDEVMRGFVKCSDGRLYHRVLAAEALKAFSKKQAFLRKRDGDAARLRKWRSTQDTTHTETPSETLPETHFVAEGQGRRRMKAQLPDDWAPSPQSRKRAETLGFDACRIDEIAENLRVWAHANAAVKADWNATFDGFIRRDAQAGFQAQGPPQRAPVRNGWFEVLNELNGSELKGKTNGSESRDAGDSEPSRGMHDASLSSRNSGERQSSQRDLARLGEGPILDLEPEPLPPKQR